MTSSELIAELRATAPHAPAPLRERVLALEARPASPRPTLFTRLTPRRAALAFACTLVVAGLGAALVHGIATSGSRGGEKSSGGFARATPATPTTSVPGQENQALRSALAPRAAREAAPLPPSGVRLQDYQVSLRVRVKDEDALSKATVKAMRLTRSYGGYVASVEYDTPGAKKGTAELVLRVPVTKVQAALLRFSALGTVVAQHVSIEDLQAGFNALEKRITILRARILDIQAQLRDPTLSPERRARLEAELANDKRQLARLVRQQQATLKQGRLARVYLDLTTAKAQQTAAPHHRGRIGRTLSDAGSILVKELSVLLYILIVAGPLLALGLAGLVLARSQRRRAEQRLLARS